MASAVACALTCAVACDGPPPLACDQGDLELSQTVGERWDPPTACASDDECVLHVPEVRCPGGGAEYSWCALGVHPDDVAAFDSTLSGVLNDVCPRIPADCRGFSLCADVVARCVDARCLAVDAQTACAAACGECLTADSCTGHCPVHRECILAADGCDAIRVCTSGPAPDAGPDGG